MVIALKVKIEMTPEQIKDYCLEYGIDRATFRDDLKRYVTSCIQGSPGLEHGVFTEDVVVT